jgi:hypothetical protein
MQSIDGPYPENTTPIRYLCYHLFMKSDMRYRRRVIHSLLASSLLLLILSGLLRSVGISSAIDWWNRVDLPPIRPVNTAAFEQGQILSESTVTVANWREVQVRLDNVYSDPAVMNIRDRAVGEFAAYMHLSDEQAAWRKRDAIRKAAVIKLKAREQEIRQFISAQGAARSAAADEAQVALLEVESLAGEYSAVTTRALPLIHDLPPGTLQEQAYFYLIGGYTGMCDVKSSQKYLQALEKINPHAAYQFYGIEPPFGPVRQIVSEYSLAQVQDDCALVANDKTLARTMADARDKTRADAARKIRRFADGPQFPPRFPPIGANGLQFL